jgi:type IV pilus assembly protein PilM
MVLSWFASRLNPIAMDIGSETIKLLQVEPRGGDKNAGAGGDGFRLVAAACETIPEEVRRAPAERDAFVGEAIKRMLGEGFRGKQVVTCLPSAQMAVQHLRMGKMSGEELTKAIPFEAAGKLPFDPNRALIRHTIAADVFQGSEAKQEVIVMAAPREQVDRHLNVLSKAKLEVVGIHVEPTALIECFSHLFRRKGDEGITTMFVDIGASATHVVIAQGKTMMFAKHIPIGGDVLNKKVADAMGVDFKKARELRIHASYQQAQASRLPAGVVGIGADANTHPLGKQNSPVPADAGAGAGGELGADAIARINAATAGVLETLTSDLVMCGRYFETIAAGRGVDRVIFTGGESRHVTMCQRVAQGLGVPATLGDPLARLMKDGVTQTKVDLRQPQPGWAIAVGLGIGLSPAEAGA